jgi:hypothetical protein
MKKAIHILVTFLLVLTIWSCRSVKTVSETNKETKTTEKKEIKKDSVNTTVINKPINDVFTIPVVKSNTNNKAKDSIINAKVDEILSKLNTTKKSGNNSYKLYYDLDKRFVELQALIGETKDTNTETNTEQTTEKTFEEKTDEYISKKIRSIPWWFYALVIFWFFPQILARVQTVINPISSFLKK